VANVVYILCALTSFACAVLLLRGFWNNGVRLLLWSGLAFLGMALNNLLLFVDLGMVPTVDLAVWRAVPVLVGLALLLYGLVWEEGR
jgi:hypothetical protein